MASTYTPIATQTLGSTQTTITFSSIPTTYTDLVLEMAPIANSTAFHIFFRLNSDAGSNYSWTLVGGDGTSAGSTRLSSQTEGRLTYYAAVRSGSPSVTTVNFQNYSNSTTKKTIISRNSRASDGTEGTVNLWSNGTPQAITSISLYDTGGQAFAVGSTFTLYGIASSG